MKRIVINILLSILILFSNSGWAVTFHYCQDQLASVSLDYASALIVEDDDACIFCQQPLSRVAQDRLHRFREYVQGTIKRRLMMQSVDIMKR